MKDAPSRASAADYSRRQVIGILGGAGAAVLVGGIPAAAPDDGTGPALDCVVTPAQTEGPYFVDERLQRSDIRPDPTTKALKDGVPLRLRINVSRVDGSACRPVEGAIVDVWQCDALGIYSDVEDFGGRFDTRGQRFLRGYQVTDRVGATEFITIYPGWYTGRTVHIHFKVRLSPPGQPSHEFTSQLYFDDAVTDRVHAQPPYDAKGQRDRRNDRDGLYRRRNDGSQLLLALREEGPGYAGSIGVGLRMA